MPQGLVEYTTTGSEAQAGGLDTDLEVSHLDSFFAGTGWTREDILTLAAMIQVLAWLSLLYLEVSKR